MTYLTVVLSGLMLLGQSCNIYSFTGASYGDAKTVSIYNFPNHAPLINPALSQQLTEKLKDRFVSQTPLTLIEQRGDLEFKGEISDYKTQPMGITAGETAANNRLTITVKVEFMNKTDEKFNYNTQFSQYSDYKL